MMGARFELYKTRHDGHQEIVVQGNMKTLADYVRHHGLTSKRDPNNPLGTFYIDHTRAIYRVAFCLDEVARTAKR
jgi:hypothetical protein